MLDQFSILKNCSIRRAEEKFNIFPNQTSARSLKWLRRKKDAALTVPVALTSGTPLQLLTSRGGVVINNYSIFLYHKKSILQCYSPKIIIIRIGIGGIIQFDPFQPDDVIMYGPCTPFFQIMNLNQFWAAIVAQHYQNTRLKFER